MTRPIDRRAIDRLVVENLPAALRMALRLAGDSHAAEDMVQETLCRVLRQWRRFRGESAFKTWMLQILVNIDRDRRRRIRPHQSIDDNHPVPASEAPAHDQAMAAELHDDIRRAVDELPPRQREVALLNWGEGLAASEIAVVLEITEANVYATLHMARKRIAQAIGADRVRPNYP